MFEPTMDSGKKVIKKPLEKEKNQHIQVVVRARPMNAQEKRQGATNLLSVVTERKEIVVKEKQSASTTKTFTFDKVFGPNSKQLEVYKEVVVPILEEVLMGYNCTIFAYGQTGTGKTFTMEGERSSDPNISWENDPLSGIIPRTLHQLFDTLSGQQADFTVRVSFVELYNEELFDLLTGPEDSQRLRLYDDPVRKGSVVIHGLEEIIVRSKEEVYEIMERGARKRQTATTLLNAQSSRSHSVFSITVHIRENTLDGEELLKTGKLYLVDLAGSENIGRSGAVDKRAREAGNINQSLLTLGRVITSLVEHGPHVPYRESKLTRLLQDSLGGKTKTSIIATVSPASTGIDETISTLDYAFRAKNITNRPEVNQKLTKKALMKEYAEEMERLRRDLQAAREKNGIYVAEENYIAMQTELIQQRDSIIEKEAKIGYMQDAMEKLNDMFTDTCNDLELTKKNLEKTTTKYSKTKEKFIETKQILHQTVRERDEKAFLVETHSEKEALLHSQAEQLLDVSRRATSHLNVLHGKVDRKETIEQKNLSTLQTFRGFVESKVETLKSNLDNFAEDENLKIDRNQQIFEKRLNESHILCKSMELELSKLESGFTEKINAFEASLHKNCKENFQIIDRFSDQTNKLSVSYEVLMQQTFCVTSDRTFQNFIVCELKNFHEVFLTESLKTMKNIVAQSDIQLVSLENLNANQQQDLVSSVQTFCVSQQQTFMSLFASLKDHKCTQVMNSNEIAQNVIQAAEKQRLMSEELKQIQDMLDSIVLRQNGVVLNEFEKIKELAEAMKKCEISANDNAERLQTILTTDLNSFKVNIETKAEESRVDSSKVLKCVNLLNTELINSSENMDTICSKFVVTTTETLEEDKRQLQSLYRSMNECLQQNIEGYSKKVKDANEFVNDERKVLTNSLMAFIEVVEDETKKRAIELQQWTKLVDDWSQSQKMAYDDLSTNTDSLVNEKLVRDKRTGDTPVRQQFRFPTDLVSTSPHESLLQRYREQFPMHDVSRIEDSLNQSHLDNLVEGVDEKENCDEQKKISNGNTKNSNRILKTPN